MKKSFFQSILLQLIQTSLIIVLILDARGYIRLSENIYFMLAIIVFAIFFKTLFSKTEQSVPIKEKNQQRSQAIFFLPNEYIEIFDQKTNQILHKLTISKIHFIDDQNLNTDIETSKLLSVEGKLENINDDIISLSPDKFFVYDNTGNQLSFYQTSESHKISTQISSGRNMTFQYSYLPASESHDIEIEYVPDSTWKKPAAIWKLTVDS